MDSVERAIADLADSLSFIRKLAASNLARYGDARAIAALEAAARDDPDAEVREEAKGALAKIRPAGEAAPAPAPAPPLEAAPAGPSETVLPSLLERTPSLRPSSHAAAIPPSPLAGRGPLPSFFEPTTGEADPGLGPARQALVDTLTRVLLAARPRIEARRPAHPQSAAPPHPQPAPAAQPESETRRRKRSRGGPKVTLIRQGQASAAVSVTPIAPPGEARVTPLAPARAGSPAEAKRKPSGFLKFLGCGCRFMVLAGIVLVVVAMFVEPERPAPSVKRRESKAAVTPRAVREPEEAADAPRQNPPLSRPLIEQGNPFVGARAQAGGEKRAVRVVATLRGTDWSSVEVRMADRAAPCRLVTLGGGGAGVYEAMLVDLPDGEHSATVVAAGSRGTFEHPIRFTVDATPPRLTIRTPPQESVVREPAVAIEGEVADASRSALRIGGEEVPLGPEGRFSHTVPLGLGEVALEIVATDAFGNVAGERLVVFRGAPVTPSASILVREYPGDGAAMCFIPAGPFVMGEAEDRENPAGSPAHLVTLGGYWIDQKPVTWSRFRRFCGATGRTPPRVSGAGGAPADDCAAIRVSWEDAAAYAAWARKRLPTEAEWEKAARGDDARRFPWGNENPGPEHGPFREKNAYQPRPTGSYPANASPYGVLDLVGCVQQWCADFYDPKYYSVSPESDPTGPESGRRRVVRGNSGILRRTAALRCAARSSATPGPHSEVGFRCAVSEADFPR